MVRRYPHKVKIITKAVATMDENGNWIQSGNPKVEIRPCRVEFNTGGSEVTLTDGTVNKYTCIVYLPHLGNVVIAGTDIVLEYGYNQSINGKVLLFVKDRNHSRLWV